MHEMKGKVVLFDIWSPYGYFRRHYTTTTALTFNFIPRSALEGVVAAIIGLRSEEYHSKLQGAKIGLNIINEVKKIPFSTMHTHSDFWAEMQAYLEAKPRLGKDFHGRASLELLVQPQYRVYFNHPDFNNELVNNLKEHQTVFTPYLGTSSMIANFDFVEYVDYTTQRKNMAEMFSIIPFSGKIPDIIIEKDKLFAIEQNLPISLNENRELTGTYSALYSPKGEKIKVRNMDVNVIRLSTGEEHNFVFLPSRIPS